MSSQMFRLRCCACLAAAQMAVGGFARAQTPEFAAANDHLIMANGFVYLEFDEKHPSIDVLRADYFGRSHYGPNLLATNGGITLEAIDADGALHFASDVHSHISYRILQQDSAGLSIQIDGMRDRRFRPDITGAWTLTLLPESRNFRLTTRTTVAHARPLKAIGIGASFHQWFMNGLFERGVMQYVSCGDRCFFTASPLNAFYTMDNHNGSVAVVPGSVPGTVDWEMRSCRAGNQVGLNMILAGNCPSIEQWRPADWQSATNLILPAGSTFQASLDFYPNDYDFPVYNVPARDPMSFPDRRTIEVATYGSAAGVLGSFEYDGSAYPTLETPKRPYGPLYTFFDPDSWSTVNTLSFSGDPYLQDQARRIIELAGSHIKDGQVPHHFDDGVPTYIAISKATQTGPNMFWVLAAIDYAGATGKTEWLRAHYPQLKAATDWVLKCYDPAHKLVDVGGPLFIDVFIRQGYTLDSNAMLLHVLPLMASVARFCDDPDSARRYRALAEAVRQGLNEGLWNGHDHYITQRSADWQPRDFVDYDGNYAAIAFGAPTNREQIAAMYRRLDGGAHTHPGGRGTWTSEKYYGPNDCFGANTGDSATAMARIWWLDLLSRYVTGDETNFYRYFTPIQGDLSAQTWLTERYNALGKSIRARYYHEYPEITAMILREMILGIDVKVDRVRIKPFGRDRYHYLVGGLDVSYSRRAVSLCIPGDNERTYEICGLLPSTSYAVSTGRTVVTDRDGTAIFKAPTGIRVSLRASSP